MMNTIGNRYRLTSFGESHGKAIGGIIDGCPAGIVLDLDFIQSELNRRRPGQSDITTSRDEQDIVEILSGVFEGKALGTPIGFMVRNHNQQSQDYDNLRDTFRPSHADYTYHAKYGIRDHRGGGRSSARETIARIMAGAIAKQILTPLGITIQACISQVGDVSDAAKMEDLIRRVRDEGDSIGGVISCICKGVPAGLGEPVSGKLSAALAAAMLSINAAKGFDYGMGFDGVGKRGSEVNDYFYTKEDGNIGFKTNHSGGIQGGISNGEDIYFRVAFKPTPTLAKEYGGRHDPCVLPRAVPIVEAMAAMTILDYYLLSMAHG